MTYRPKYYDVVLVGVFLAMVMGAVVGLLTDLPVTASVTAFALLAVVIIGHALFVNGPVDSVEDLSEEFEGLN